MTRKVAVITGGASGIGRATAFAFARQGARVFIGDIDAKAAEDTGAKIRDTGGESSCACMDVTKGADVQQMVQRAVDQYGSLAMPSTMPASSARWPGSWKRPKRIGNARWRPT